MLIAHSSSTCDVCYDTYSEGISYHCIPCGHVFCLSCLIATSPSRCPLCRQDFSVHTMRKIHLDLPSSRDHFARALEMKLVQTSPDMTLAESLSLFQEVQDWLDEQPDEEYLVLRAFAAVLCGFHEMKDKLSTTERNFEQFRAEATEKEEELRRSLEEARNTSDLHINDYKSKYRETKAALTQLETEAELLQSQLDQYKEREKQNQSTLDAVRNLYQTAKMELMTIRDECTELRTHATKYQEAEQKRIAEYRDYYSKIETHIQTQVQAQVQAQTQSLVKAVEARAHSRRQSNPLPPPPKQVEIPFIKYMAKSTAARRASNTLSEMEEERRHSRAASPNSPSKASSSNQQSESDPMSSVFVPTLAAAYPSRRLLQNTSDARNGHSEVTTLVFKPPKRVPLWGDTRAESNNAPTSWQVPSASERHADVSRETPRRLRSSQEPTGLVSEDEQSDSNPNTTLTIAPTPTQAVAARSAKANTLPSYLTYDEYVSYEDPPYVEKYPGWGGAGFVSPFAYTQPTPAQEVASPTGASRPLSKPSDQTPTQSPRRVSSPPVLPSSTRDAQDVRRTRLRTQSQLQSQAQPHPQHYQYSVEDAPEGAYEHHYYNRRHHFAPPPPTVVRFRFREPSSRDSEEEAGYEYDGQQQAYSGYKYPNTRRIVVEEVEN